VDRDKRKFEKIYDAYWLEIKKFIYVSARRDKDATDDIFQNTWENAYRYFDSLKNEDAARAWLYSIARNEARRYFEKNRDRFSEVSPDAAGAAGGDAGGEAAIPEPRDESESAFADALADSELVKQLLNCLGTDEQRMILMHYAYGVKLKEMAEMTGENYNTVKSVTRRALAKMKEEYARLVREDE
jgi:RNA polymerase sigma factor (sigma-70 family)